MELKEEIKTEAIRLGFPFCGFSLPNPPAHGDKFLSWLGQGCHAGMTYLSNPESILKRSDPKILFPDCKTILSLAIPYQSPDLDVKPVQGQGQIASYAWGRDYHQVVREKLDHLVRAISTLVGHEIKAKPCVDTSPILEKDYAQSAGLGWIGKNSCLIIPRYGSYFFLAELLLDLPLEPDSPYSHDGCKNCTQCLDVCPTQAIRSDRSIDSRRCLSYLTIEHRGAIPVEFRKHLGSQIFGCDICQTVCPHNLKPKKLPVSRELCTALINPYPSLEAELTLQEEAFRQKYTDTPVLRTKWSGYLRNIVLALGNQGKPVAVSTLKAMAQKAQDEVIQEACDWSLSNFSLKS